jgi:hypothetical protein
MLNCVNTYLLNSFLKEILTTEDAKVPKINTNNPNKEINRRSRGDSSFSGKENTVAVMMQSTINP